MTMSPKLRHEPSVHVRPQPPQTPDLLVRGVTVEFASVTKPAPSTKVTRPTRVAATFAAVDHVNLEVAPGEIVALLGPSGCGKSTLLRTIAGLEVPTAGTVSWQGADLARVAVHKRGFGLMFQDGQLFAHKLVAGNVEYGLKILGLSKSARARRVAELLALVGLPGAQSRNVSTMSGGERQRVALARALAPKPQLLLLDEPLSALDRELRERLAVDLRTILKSTGTGAVFVTHDQDEAFAVADRVAVMRRGKILQIDTPQDLWDNPASREVAEFLGFEAFSSGPPMRAYAPGHFTVTQILGDTSPAPVTTALGASEVSGGSVPETLSGSVDQVLFRGGRTLARVNVPGLGVLTCVVGVPDLAPGQWVKLQASSQALAAC